MRSLRAPALYLQSPSSQESSSETEGTAALKPHDPAQETQPGSVYAGLICINDVNYAEGERPHHAGYINLCSLRCLRGALCISDLTVETCRLNRVPPRRVSSEFTSWLQRPREKKPKTWT